MNSEIAAYIAQQPRLAWRRYLLRLLIQTLGFRVLWKLSIHGLEHIPNEGGAILVMNHISGIDPILCMGAISNRYAIPMTKIENAQHPILGGFVRWYGAFTVQRGEVDRAALFNAIELIKSGQLVLIAPEGTRNPAGLQVAHDGLAYVATKSEAILIPVGVSGAVGWESDLKALRRKTIRLDFGRPFRFKTDGRTRIPREELSQMTQEAMYQLAATLPDPALRGAYADLERMTTETLVFTDLSHQK
ncbi:MAG: 1-acyl-sn-glycerol-3-phosphate acyltransferase [Anaerolineae bacterium]|nr:1-acyl-sn-glycerol-3-phosphate acyltransferase [Anaerolineae bacterium]